MIVVHTIEGHLKNELSKFQVIRFISFQINLSKVWKGGHF